MSDTKAGDKDPPDGGWGWFIVIATFITSALGTGSFYAFGVLYVAFLDAFGQSKAATSLVGTILAFGIVMMGSVGLALSRRFGHRTTVIAAGILTSTSLLVTSFMTSLYQVYFTYGLAGCGMGMAVVPCVEMIGVYFKRRLSLAIGLAMAGTGGGQCLLSIVTQLMVDTYGWRGTLTILSAMSANICVAGALLKPLNVGQSSATEYKVIPTSKDLSPEQQTNKHIDDKMDMSLDADAMDNCCDLWVTHPGTDREPEIPQDTNKPKCKPTCLQGLCAFFRSLYDISLFKEPIFYIVLFTGLCQSVGHNIVIIHSVKRGREFGISSTFSSLIPALMGLSQLVGRPVWGALGSTHTIKPYVIYAVAMAICGVSSIISIYEISFAAQLTFIILFGIGIGGYIVFIPVVLVYFVGVKRMGYGMSCVWQVHGVVGLFIGTLSGWMRDNSGSYAGVFWLAGVSLIVGAIAALMLPVVDKIVQRNRRTFDDVDGKVEFQGGNEELLVAECMTSI